MTLFSLVHGGQQGAWCFEPLAGELERRGHQSIAIDLPVEDPAAGASEYADAVVESLAGVEDEVIVVGHSLGGLTIPLVAQQRPVSLLVFLCAALPEPGRSLRDVIAEDARSDSATPDLLDDDDQRHLTPREQAREVFFPDLPRELQDWALDRQRPQCETPHREITPLVEWPDVPVALVSGLFDRCISIGRARGSALRIFGETPVELQDGHFPFLTSPAFVADELDRLARGDAGGWPTIHARTRAGVADG